MDAFWTEVFPFAIDPVRYGIVAVRLFVAALLGGLVGLQRERQRKEAGLRTHMLVSLGSALFMLAPVMSDMEIKDMSRIIQGIATGIGFLGGGAIVKLSDHRDHEIKGLTSAATIWLTAGIGMAAGMGLIYMAVLVVLLAWVILATLGWAEKKVFAEKAASDGPGPKHP